jgi:rubrerythrin
MKEAEKVILAAQKNEITEHFIYESLAQSVKDLQNKEVLKRISSDELKHYSFWRRIHSKRCKAGTIEDVEVFFDFKNFWDNFWNKTYGKGRRESSSNL